MDRFDRSFARIISEEAEVGCRCRFLKLASDGSREVREGSERSEVSLLFANGIEYPAIDIVSCTLPQLT